jgi:ketosteroid isomerase-like protein
MPANVTTPTGSPVPKVSPAAPGDPVQDKAIKELQDFYNTYHETAKTGDFAKIRTFISRDHQKLFDSWDAKTTEANGQHTKNNLAEDMVFKGGKVDGDMGYLWINGRKVKGLLDGKELKYCLVTFRKEDGQWKIVKEHWADRPGNLQ